MESDGFSWHLPSGEPVRYRHSVVAADDRRMTPRRPSCDAANPSEVMHIRPRPGVYGGKLTKRESMENKLLNVLNILIKQGFSA
jgi:hypothetical protein